MLNSALGTCSVCSALCDVNKSVKTIGRQAQCSHLPREGLPALNVFTPLKALKERFLNADGSSIVLARCPNVFGIMFNSVFSSRYLCNKYALT